VKLWCLQPCFARLVKRSPKQTVEMEERKENENGVDWRCSHTNEGDWYGGEGGDGSRWVGWRREEEESKATRRYGGATN